MFREPLPGSAHGANWRVAEDHGRDVVVVQMLVRFVVKQTLGKATARGNGNRRQLNGTGIVADGIKYPARWCSGIYQRRCSLFVGFHAGNSQIEVVRFLAHDQSPKSGSLPFRYDHLPVAGSGCRQRFNKTDFGIA